VISAERKAYTTAQNNKADKYITKETALL